MKNGTFLWSGVALRAAGIAVLALAVMFAACSNPAGGESSGGNADKTALNTAIETAEAAKAGVSVSANGTGSDVALGTQCVTSIQLTTFNAAITTAQGIRNNVSASQPLVDGAVTTLNNAIDDFNAAKQPGTLELDLGPLDAKITEAETARDSVVVAADAAGAAKGAKWATQEEVNILQAAITAAQAPVTSPGAVTSAVNTLNIVLSTFTSTISSRSGTKETGFTQANFDTLKTNANAAKAVATSSNGNDVPPTASWVTSQTMNDLEAAIGAAPSTVNDSAYLALSTALIAFNTAKQPGTTPDKTDLNTAIKSANTARAGVEIAAIQNEAPGGSAWVTKAQWDALNTAYTTAAGAATQNAVTQATTALNDAISDFTEAKSDNGPGTAVNALTITGLGAIYNNGAEVYVGVLESNEFDPSSEPDNFEQEIVTNGSLTIPLETLPNGSYYVGFSSDGIIIFISKATVLFKGAMKNIAYDTVNFELYTHSLNFGDMGMPPNITATLNQVIEGMAGDMPGSPTTYTAWKNAMRQMLSGELGGNYVNLNDVNVLDVALYKNAACTQEFTGTETVNSATVVYTKFSLAEIMSGGDGPPGPPVEAAGYINGTVNLIGGSSGQEVFIGARYGDNQIYQVDGQGILSAVESNGSFSIPFTYEFLAALESKAQELYFSLYIHDTGSGGGYDKYTEPKTVTNSGLIGNTLNVGSLGTVSLAFINLSGTITVTYNGQPVPRVRISARYDTNIPSIMGNGYSELKSPGSGAPWSVPVPVFASQTTLNISVSGFNSSGNSIFYTNIQTVSAHSTPVTVPAINLAIVTLTGTADVTISGQKPDNIGIAAYTNADNPWGSQIGSTSITNYASESNTWSMNIVAPAPGTTVYFGINWWPDGDMGLTGEAQVATITYSGGPVTPIALSHSGSSSGPGPGL
jgi:hypothetical protein